MLLFEGGFIPNSRGLEEKRNIPNCMLHTGVGGRGWVAVSPRNI